MCAEHKDTNWPEAQLCVLFSQEFILGRKGLGRGKIKSLFDENRKEILAWIEFKHGIWYEEGL